MTDMVNVENDGAVSNKFLGNGRSGYEIDETYWGYIVRGVSTPNYGILAAQTVSMFLGAVFLASAAAVMFLPSATVGMEHEAIRYGVSVIFAAVAILFLWYASRGTDVELQVDTNLGELREVVRSRSGRTSLLGRYGFDAIGGVFIDRSKAGDIATLVVRYRNTAQTLVVASGLEEDLALLRNRMGRDVLVS